MGDYGVVLFHTTSAAFAAEKTFAKAAVDCALIPVPREISSDCGVALRFDWSQAANAARILEEAGVEVAGIHRVSTTR
jgi:hypothetical protein